MTSIQPSNHFWQAARGLLLGLLMTIAGPALATQEYILPTLFEVTGVAADDRLNIRAAPNASAQIIGTFAPNARNIEVVATDSTGQWGRVNTGERSGWASMRFLAYRTDVWTGNNLPATLHCLGNEPFWALGRQGAGVVFSTPDLPDTEVRLEEVLSTGVFRDPRRSIVAEGAGRRLTAVMVPMECSDGMSDRAYGLDITLIIRGASATQMLTGCCSIAAR